ncbi:hypothetical protein GUJ93_ZPchr0060g7196, partial [Zizania palustris]
MIWQQQEEAAPKKEATLERVAVCPTAVADEKLGIAGDNCGLTRMELSARGKVVAMHVTWWRRCAWLRRCATKAAGRLDGVEVEATTSDPIPCARHGGPTSAYWRNRWGRSVGGPAVAGRPVCMLVHLLWARHVAHAWGVQAAAGRLVRVLLHNPQLHNPLLSWARCVAHAWGVPDTFFVLQP